MDSTLGKNISIFIQNQFPSFYQEEGKTFIDFVTEYYKWFEGQTAARNEYFCEQRELIKVVNRSANIIGLNTTFLTSYANGDSIAICKGIETDDYEMFTIDTVSNNTFLTLKTDRLPTFSLSNTRHGTVSLKENPMYYSRRFLQNKDIDSTTEEFIVYFKEKYLKGIQFTTRTDNKRLIKNSLDLYRSKGTERSLNLFFKIVFGINSEIYYPSEDIFKLSSGKWVKPQYIELNIKESNVKLINKEVIGLTSGAIAFCESVIRKNINGKLIDVIYISAVNGIFKTGEKINTRDNSLETDEMPTIVGSLTNILFDVSGSGSNFNVGDILSVTSSFGTQGQAKVVSVSNTSGLLTIELLDGGYGYTANAAEVFSNTVVKLDNVNSTKNVYFNTFETLVQPYITINYLNSTNTISVGDNVSIYDTGSTLIANAVVTELNVVNSSSGNASVAVLSGNISTIHYINTAIATANISITNGYIDKTATANVIGIESNVEIFAVNVQSGFISDEEIYQEESSIKTAYGKYKGFISTVGTNAVFNISDAYGTFKPNKLIYGTTSGKTANAQKVSIYVGLKTLSNSYTIVSNNFVYGLTSNTTGEMSFIYDGTGINYNVSNSLLYSETISLNTDLLANTATVNLNASAWGLSGNVSANIQSTEAIIDLLSYTNTVIGKIETLFSSSQGEDYNRAPILNAYESDIYKYRIPSFYVLNITPSFGFISGELITQSATGARGIIQPESNSTVLIVQRLNFNSSNTFTLTSNSTTQLLGDVSGEVANVTYVDYLPYRNPLGYNSTFSTSLNTTNGSITEVEVTDSGFGFVDGETVTLTSSTNNTTTGIASDITSGRGRGFYLRTGGLLSSNKKLFDGFYYQDYSYEIRSSKTLDKYEDMLKQVMHVVGTKYFGALATDGIGTLTLSGKGVITSSNT